MKTFNAQILRLLAYFSVLTGTKFVGIREYISVKTGEVANFVINANFNYGNAVKTSIEILKSLTANDFLAIEAKYDVVNSEGTEYGSNAGATKYLETGKRPKEGTKARETVMAGVKQTKQLATVCAEMVQTFLDNQNDATRSVMSEAQKNAYEPITKGVKRNIKSQKLHIWAMSHSKEVLIEGEYAESNLGIEASQKNAIERYCKSVLDKQLPTTKYRTFVVEPNQLSEVKVTGETVVFI
jgi:hypothetical protein